LNPVRLPDGAARNPLPHGTNAAAALTGRAAWSRIGSGTADILFTIEQLG
jgi:hypothetical protein